MNQDKKITAGAFAITVLATLPFSNIAIAETPVSETNQTATSGDFVVDISNWKCEDCAFEEGFSAELELGVGNVSDPSYKFGEYNGLYEDGAFLVLNGKARYRGEDANYYDLSVEDLGLDTRSLDIEGGKQGSYKLFFRYDEINHAISDSIMTPYIGNGSDTLTLPVSWVTAGNTSGMSDLAASLQSYDVDLKRKRMDIGFSFNQASSWKYDLKYRREVREGAKASAGSFSFNAAQIIEPVDYVTDEIDASASYIGERWQATMAYYGSFFTNENKSLTWENAYTPGPNGEDSGQLALAPDNLFHQLILSAGYQISDKTRLSGDISMGRMEQDEDFLPATINSSLVVPALPRDSADAQVDTLHGNIRVISSISDKLRLNASYNYSDHDNQTPQSAYTWVRTDNLVKTPTTNQPYSFTRQETRLGGDYRFSRSTKLSAGVDYDSLERSLQEVDKTTETTTWGKLIVRGKDFMDMTIKAALAERDITNYQVVPEILTPENPLLRKYNMTDRSRATAGVTVNAMLGETMSVGFGIDYADDDYTESTIGLTDASELSINADASAILSETSSIHAFVSQERIESQQAGSSTFSSPNWYAENDDTVNTIGIGYKQRMMEDRLDLGVDYVISQSTGKINILFSADESFPDLEVDLKSLKFYADYRMKDNMSVHAAYIYESYDTKDWSLDNVDPDTVSNVLGFGELSPNYDVGIITVSLRYKF